MPQNSIPELHEVEAKNLSHIEQAISDGIAAFRGKSGSVCFLGFSFGATLSMDMASSHPDIAAVVDFYGKAYPWIEQRPVHYKAPTIVLQGEIDTEAPVINAEKLQKYFEENKIPHIVHIYPAFGHTFNADPSASISQDAEKRVRAFLDQYYPVQP